MTDPLTALAQRARNASHILSSASTVQKNAALAAVQEKLESCRAQILEANDLDKKGAASDKNLSSALVKRLDLSGDKFATLIQGLSEVQVVADPVGVVSLARELDQNLELYRVSCPIGVLCVIFESRPEAAVQIASLAIKSGNAVILKGGKEALNSNKILVECIQSALEQVDLPRDCVQLVATREDVGALLKLDKYIDLVIPRGGNALVRNVMDNTSIPVMGHADGICSVYVDKYASKEMAENVVVDAKTQYTAACNTAETLLIHRDSVASLLPGIGKRLAAKGVKLHADAHCLPYLPKSCTVLAQEKDFRTEYLGLEMAVKMVDDVEAAIVHINEHGSHHTEVIITENEVNAERFMQAVGSAGVFHNASSRFADGFRFGFGAEVGVSTNRIHARGPVGLEGLLIYKYRLHGKGQCAGDYGIGAGQRHYTHRSIPMTSDRAPAVGTFAMEVAQQKKMLIIGSCSIVLAGMAFMIMRSS